MENPLAKFIHPTDESGPIPSAMRIEHFTNPKSHPGIGLRNAFGNYNPTLPGQGNPGSPIQSYFTRLGFAMPNGLTRILNNGKNKIVF